MKRGDIVSVNRIDAPHMVVTDVHDDGIRVFWFNKNGDCLSDTFDELFLQLVWSCDFVEEPA